MGNCISCHTRPDGEPFSGGLRFETDFGTIFSSNITPDVETGIGAWTRAQFLRSMREGVDAKGEHLYPAFPYTAFTKVTDADLNAIFAYLETVPAVRYRGPSNDLTFPFNRRAMIGVWKAIYFEPGVYQPDSMRSEEWNRGAYLVQGLAHCGGCHTPRNFLGAERQDWALTGAIYQDRVQTGKYRDWSAVNLTSAPSGLGPWSLDDIAGYLEKGINNYASAYGPMVEVIMNSTRHFNTADLRAVSVYLKSLAPKAQTGGLSATDDVLTTGEYLYTIHCATCHLETGRGSSALGPSLQGNPVVQAFDPASLINVIAYGPRLPNPPLPAQWQPMEAYAVKLADEEIAAIASFVRRAWGNQGGAVTANQVAKQID
ncbi:MAG: cytochrome c [Gammaproteobacteria bacterium]|nr:cytochrome c [Gammaproteobacteria bacterium]